MHVESFSLNRSTSFSSSRGKTCFERSSSPLGFLPSLPTRLKKKRDDPISKDVSHASFPFLRCNRCVQIRPWIFLFVRNRKRIPSKSHASNSATMSKCSNASVRPRRQPLQWTRENKLGSGEVGLLLFHDFYLNHLARSGFFIATARSPKGALKPRDKMANDTPASSKSSEKKKSTSSAERARRSDPLWKAILPIVGVLLVGLGPTMYTHGWRVFLPSGTKTLHIDEDTWMEELLPNHTFIFVAGHHRGGTTLMWEILREHPDVGSFGLQSQTGVDKSEGVFLQDLLPQFGVGAETTWLHRVGLSNEIMRGVGTYAVEGYDSVVWNEVTHKDEISIPNLVKLLNQWSYFWKANSGLEKHYLIEKTPTNAVLSRFLQALFDQGIQMEQTMANLQVPWEVPRDSRTKFIFMMRHPIANALAHQQWSNAKHLSLDKLLQNWLSISEIMTRDCKHLKNCLFVRLEELADNPEQELSRIFSFLGLPSFKWSTKINAAPNAKYEQEYCSRQSKFVKGQVPPLIEHYGLIRKYGDQVKEYGYDLSEWKCLMGTQKAILEHLHKQTTAKQAKEEL